MKNICDFCRRETDHTKKTLVKISDDEFADHLLCKPCIEEISRAAEEAEINKVKELKKRGSHQ